jgi:hypothetical protein
MFVIAGGILLAVMILGLLLNETVGKIVNYMLLFCGAYLGADVVGDYFGKNLDGIPAVIISFVIVGMIYERRAASRRAVQQ